MFFVFCTSLIFKNENNLGNVSHSILEELLSIKIHKVSLTSVVSMKIPLSEGKNSQKGTEEKGHF